MNKRRRQPRKRPRNEAPSGPFQHDASGQAIAKFLFEELNPVVGELRQLAVDVSGFKLAFWASFTTRGLRNLEELYNATMKRFMTAYKKWQNPDELFGEVPPKDDEEAGPMLADYLRFSDLVDKSINEGFRLVGHIDGVLSQQRSIAYNRVAMMISIAAITVSIIVAVFQISLSTGAGPMVTDDEVTRLTPDPASRSSSGCVDGHRAVPAPAEVPR